MKATIFDNKVMIAVLMGIVGVGALATTMVSAKPAPKVQVCHVPPGNPANAHMITISKTR